MSVPIPLWRDFNAPQLHENGDGLGGRLRKDAVDIVVQFRAKNVANKVTPPCIRQAEISTSPTIA
jgi:hypothetical protein